METCYDGFHDRITGNEKQDNRKKDEPSPRGSRSILKASNIDCGMEGYQHKGGNRTLVEICVLDIWNTRNNQRQIRISYFEARNGKTK
jgi:hypothetical protein